MRIYRWQSEVLENYSRGDILAVGATVEEARINARAGFEPYAREHFSYLVPNAMSDEEDKEQWQELFATFERDIASEPEEALAFYIQGSD